MKKLYTYIIKVVCKVTLRYDFVYTSTSLSVD